MCQEYIDLCELGEKPLVAVRRVQFAISPVH
jgi:hypothetical protein